MNDERIVGVEVDGTMYTTGMVRELVKRNEALQEGNYAANRRLENFQREVRTEVTEMVSNTVLTKSDANEFLEALGLDKLPTHYTATLTVTMEVEFDSTADEGDVTNHLEDLVVDATHYGSPDELDDVNITRVEIDVTDLAEDE